MSATRRRTAIAWPEPTPQAKPIFSPPPAPAPSAVHAAPVVVPPLEPLGRPAPAQPAPPAAPAPAAAPSVAAGPLHRFIPPSPPAPPAPAPQPGAPTELRAAAAPAVATDAPIARFVPPVAPQPPAPPVAVQPPVAPQPPAPPVAVQPPVAPQPPARPVAAQPAQDGGPSTAPPGFSGARIIAAESAQLLALDPTFEDDEPEVASAEMLAPYVAPANLQALMATAAPEASPAAAPAAAPREIGGSRLLGAIAGLIPRGGDTARLRGDRSAAVRLAVGVLLAIVGLVVVGPALAGTVEGVPVIGPALDQLKAFTLYPQVYGLTWLTGVLAIASIFGIVTAHMEQQAHKQGMRQDPVRRLNIALAGLLALTVGAGLFTTVSAHGWAAGAAATGFFTALCLLIPIGRLPGARAMQSQPERAWVLLFLLSIPALVLAPSIPTILLLLLAFTRVRTNWPAISAGTDAHAGGPVDGTNRLSALVITLGVLIAASLGMHAMQQTSDEVRELRQGDQVTRVPGAVPGPTIDELRR